MPPKGWRKNAEGQYPSNTKDSDLTSIDDILFPRATVQKIAKSILSTTSDDANANTIMAKDSVIAIQRSATVFVSHLMFHARQISKESSRKTVNAQDILAAIEKADFPGFLPEVKQKLATFEQNKALNKKEKKPKQKEESKETEAADTDEPQAKRIKESGPSVKKESAKEGEKEAEDDDEEDQDEEDDEEEEDIENDDDEDDEEEEEEADEAVRTKNPISLLERDEIELNEADHEDKEDGDDDEDEEEDEEDD